MVDVDGTPTKSLFYAMSIDGRSFTPRVKLPTQGPAHHPQLVSADGAVVVAWDESGEDERRVITARAATDAAGVPKFQREPTGDSALGRYPALATGETRVVSAWVESVGLQSVVQVER